MDDERLEHLLRGYRLPDVSRELDQRVLHDGAAILARARFWAQVEDVGRLLLHRLGFGYLAFVADCVISGDAEYRVVVI